MNDFTISDQELINDARALLHWTPSAKKLGTDGLLFSIDFHAATVRCFLKTYDQRLAALSPGLHESLITYLPPITDDPIY